MRESVFVIVLDSNSRALLQHRDASAMKNPNTWSLWSGMLEQGETPRQAAVRELKEELDIDISPELLEPYKIYNDSDRTRHVFVLKEERVNSSYQLREGDDWRYASDSDLAGLDLNEISLRILRDFLESR